MKRRFIIVLAIIIGSLTLIWAVGPREVPDNTEWDVHSTKKNGAKVMATLLSELGMPLRIERTLPEQAGAPVLILDDYYSEEDEEHIFDYVRAGGTVVEAAHEVLDSGRAVEEYISSTTELKKKCDWPELADVDTVIIANGELVEKDTKTDSCFDRGLGVWLTRKQMGKGKIYTLSGGEAFLNSMIGEEDNVILLVRLLEQDGIKHGKVIRYFPNTNIRPIRPKEELWTFVPRFAWLALFQLLLAFGALIYWRIIRPFPVAREHLMTLLPGSTSVLALGYYLWSTKRVGAVGTMARNDLYARLRTQTGIVETESTYLVEVVSQAVNWPKEKTHEVLFGAEPKTRTELFELSLKIAEIDQAFAAGPRS